MGKNEKKKVQIQKKLPRKAGPELEESPAQSKSASAEAKPKSRMKRKATEKLRDAETMTGLPSASEPDPYSKRTSIRHISRRYSKPIRPSLLYRDEEWSSTSTEEEENDEEKVDKKRKAEVSGKTVKGRTKRKKRVEEKPKKERKVPVKPPERKQSIGADPTMKRLEELTQMAFAMGIDSEAIEAIIPETV
ncbi:hepatoma-derived growth factor-related protein 2-like [Cylas formicarius]|uniref:hepatoma-derived growth factor-related protein 2-like n=1 Tax=Cylas formicarius TaxID=197179 RepID=UPI0029589641|nr:hepatoma-derived growth factor-related protein 2-like [Cylas formicarius]